MTVLSRQLVENLMRKDIPAIARARGLAKIKEALEGIFKKYKELGARAPGRELLWGKIEKGLGAHAPEGFKRRLVEEHGLGAHAPDSNELDEITGQYIKFTTGKLLAGRTVRQYLALLTLPEEVQRIAEAEGIPEGSLRHVVSLSREKDQLMLVKQIAASHLTSAQVAKAVKHLKAHPGDLGAAVSRAVKKPPTVVIGASLLRLAKLVKKMEKTQLDIALKDLLRWKEYQEYLDAALFLEEKLTGPLKIKSLTAYKESLYEE